MPSNFASVTPAVLDELAAILPIYPDDMQAAVKAGAKYRDLTTCST